MTDPHQLDKPISDIFTAMVALVAVPVTVQLFLFSGTTAGGRFDANSASIGAAFTFMSIVAIKFGQNAWRRGDSHRVNAIALFALACLLGMIAASNYAMSGIRQRHNLVHDDRQNAARREAATADAARRRALDEKELIRLDQELSHLKWGSTDDVTGKIAALKSDPRWADAGECRNFDGRLKAFCIKYDDLNQQQQRHELFNALSAQRDAVVSRLQAPAAPTTDDTRVRTGVEVTIVATYLNYDLETFLTSTAFVQAFATEVFIEVSWVHLLNLLDLVFVHCRSERKAKKSPRRRALRRAPKVTLSDREPMSASANEQQAGGDDPMRRTANGRRRLASSLYSGASRQSLVWSRSALSWVVLIVAAVSLLFCIGAAIVATRPWVAWT